MAEISRDVFKHIRSIQIRTVRTVNDALAGAYHSAFKGRGMEFEDVREYTPGDEVRSIDWNVTARMRFPYIKNYREERELTVMLVVDVSASAIFGTHGRQKKDLLAEIAAVLALSAIKNNDKVGLILFSDGVEKYLPPKKGVTHVLRVIRELLVYETQKRTTDLALALNFLGKVQKRQGVCFLLSDFLFEAPYKELAIAAKRHDLISLCLTDPKELVLPDIGGLIQLKDLETGEDILVDMSSPEVREGLTAWTEGRIEKYKELMSKMGAGYISLLTDQPYHTAIQKYFLLRERLR